MPATIQEEIAHTVEPHQAGLLVLELLDRYIPPGVYAVTINGKLEKDPQAIVLAGDEVIFWPTPAFRMSPDLPAYLDDGDALGIAKGIASGLALTVVMLLMIASSGGVLAAVARSLLAAGHP